MKPICFAMDCRSWISVINHDYWWLSIFTSEFQFEYLTTLKLWYFLPSGKERVSHTSPCSSVDIIATSSLAAALLHQARLAESAPLLYHDSVWHTFPPPAAFPHESLHSPWAVVKTPLSVSSDSARCFYMSFPVMMHKHPPQHQTLQVFLLWLIHSAPSVLLSPPSSPSLLAVFRAAEGKWMASALPAGPITQQLARQNKRAHTHTHAYKEYTHRQTETDRFTSRWDSACSQSFTDRYADVRTYPYLPPPPPPLPFQIYISSPTHHSPSPPPSTLLQTPGH